jgi:hypothetical protein
MSEFAAWVAGVFIGTAFTLIMHQAFQENTVAYKQGQVDAVSGKMLYELKDKPDGTREWERKAR